jgi:hypothetical protein
MKKIVKIIIALETPKKILSEYQTQFDTTDTTTVLELKTNIKSSILLPLDSVEETLFNGGKELNNSDLLPKSLDLKYLLVVSDKKKVEFGLGRHYVEDIRDTNHLIVDAFPKTVTNLTSKYWDDNSWWGDQGNTPMCVGYAWAHWIEDGPITHVSNTHPVVAPDLIYHEAQKVDEWPGENYDGTSVRGAAKYLRTAGKISSYLWAFDVNTLINTVLNIGPVVIGSNWYNNMFYPDGSGLIRVAGRLAGGHAYVINGVDTKTQRFRIKNSWGRSWGQQGHAYISFTDMSRLIRENGEVCLAVENRF